MGSGMARGAAARGVRIAFGDGRTIRWSPQAHEIYRNNPNVAPPGSEGARDLEWRRYFGGGNRGYARGGGGKFIFNPSFRAPRGEFFFDAAETAAAGAFGSGFIVIDGYIPPKPQSQNKKWGNYPHVAAHLAAEGRDIRQFRRPGQCDGLIPGVKTVETPNFRAAAAVLANAALYIGPEGGLHHAAAAVRTPAVVLFGGFISPQTTGYDGHANLFTGGQACGSLRTCDHCRQAMARITTEMVIEAAQAMLGEATCAA